MPTSIGGEAASRMNCEPRPTREHYRRGAMMALGVAAIVLTGADPAAVPPGVPNRDAQALELAPRHGTVTRYKCGRGGQSYWLFEPNAPTPERAPVIVFLHGWMFTNPGLYGAWIDHLVRHGSIVIFPRFQADWASRPVSFSANVQSAVHDALRVLQTAPGHVRPDRDRFALIGHSVGADLAVHVATIAGRVKLPEPRALLLLMPGRLDIANEPAPEAIPAGALLVVAVGDQDYVVGDQLARDVFDGAVSIPKERKSYVVFRSDVRGRRPLIAGHMAPAAMLPLFDTGEGPLRALQIAQAEVDVFDRLGFWRLGDLVLEAGFSATTFDQVALPDHLRLDFGSWEDGQPIVSPIISNSPSELPRLRPSLNALLLLRGAAPSWRTLDYGAASGQALGRVFLNDGDSGRVRSQILKNEQNK